MNDGSLDPADWERYRRLLHDAVDGVVDDLAGVREQPAWRPVPDAVKAALREPLPRAGEPLEATLARFDALVRPYPTGNRHPRFFGWVHGAGNAAGIVAELLAAGMNANTGGREHAAVYVERAVVAWFAELFGFPPGSSGILTSGTSMGNLLAVVAARDAAFPGRKRRLRPARLTAYAARGRPRLGPQGAAHRRPRRGSLAHRPGRRSAGDRSRAARAPHRGRRAPPASGRSWSSGRRAASTPARSTGSSARRALRAARPVAARRRRVRRARGREPRAGAPRDRDRARRLAGVRRAQVAARAVCRRCVLFRDERAHRAAFASAPEYLARAERGTAAGAPWFADYGLEFSREFRALKVWFTLRHYGIERLGASIARTCALAAALAERVRAADDLELLAPAGLNVVCFRCVLPGLDEPALERLNDAVAVAVQERGDAVLSTTRIAGRRALRACIVNHRTREDDLDLTLAAVRAAARDVAAAGSPP